MPGQRIVGVLPWKSRPYLKILSWKSRLWYRYRPEGIFRIFFCPDSGPPPPRFYSEKGELLGTGHFSPLHGLCRKKGRDWYWYTFLFSLLRAENCFKKTKNVSGNDSSNNFLGVVSPPHLPVGKNFLRFCLA